MRAQIRLSCPESESYRAARAKSLFNVDDAARFELDAELPDPAGDWQIGVIVGPSGSGKSSLGNAYWRRANRARFSWPADAPVIDAIGPGKPFDDVVRALTSVGLGSVPAWLRPFRVLSTGERFRAELARIVVDAPGRVVIDEFTSVVDRQIARIGASAFAKQWRRTGGKALLLTCHYDILPWVRPDWTFDTKEGRLAGRWVRRRPPIDIDIFETDRRWWPLFEPHHYLKLPPMIAAWYYVGFVGDEPVAHVAVSTRPGLREARACRLVVLPEWQGAGVGMAFLNAVCGLWRAGRNRYGKPMPTLFHTSHPGLAAALRGHPLWTQVSGVLHGGHKAQSAAEISASAVRDRWPDKHTTGYGGHFRAVQGFRYLGPPA